MSDAWVLGAGCGGGACGDADGVSNIIHQDQSTNQ